MQQIHYMGYLMDENVVHVDLDKKQFIYHWPASKTMTELYTFLGLSNLYHRFML
jgi:hypothetical protein